jgi:excinuclease ABC subunit A
LGGRKQVGMGFKRLVTDNTPRLILEGAKEHNLKDVSIEFPLQRLVCVTGVSGSGKSSLIQDVLAPALLRHFGKSTETPGAHDRLMGADHLSDVVFVDQSPIGKTARSNPASYVVRGMPSEKYFQWRLCLGSAVTQLPSSALTAATDVARPAAVQALNT